MKKFLILLLFSTIGYSQTNSYTISFENAEHHEANVSVTFPELQVDTLIVRMSRTSPGRYALHEFAKNVYGIKATDSRGNLLKVVRRDPFSWSISGHDGEVTVKYILFGNRGDGTYTQVDQSHAHLNIPATFLYSDLLKDRPITVRFQTKQHPGWKIATQLKHLEGNSYYAPDLYYFMDSPVEISDHSIREFTTDGQTIRFVLHHLGTSDEFDTYFQRVKKIVAQEKAVFGELPEYDYGTYTFLACYMPNVSGDGMEHRNSTILTDVESLGAGGMDANISTVSHEFFHAWNVERIRPASLEPFDFSNVNMSGALWFAEGFTSYYTGLILARAGIRTPEEYVKGLNGTFNYVWNSPARKFFSPVEMSHQATFVDAAVSVDPVNSENTFISYYSYGSILGLALDLELRMKGLNLDDFMQNMWRNYGVPEIPYTLEQLEASLTAYAGKNLSQKFFESYIYHSKMPDYKKLLASVGLRLDQRLESPFFGPRVAETDQEFFIRENPQMHTPAYQAGLDKGDRIISVNGKPLKTLKDWKDLIAHSLPGDSLKLEIERFGQKLEKTVKLGPDPEYYISIDHEATPTAVKARNEWLEAR